jgi:hypothetical protein
VAWEAGMVAINDTNIEYIAGNPAAEQEIRDNLIGYARFDHIWWNHRLADLLLKTRGPRDAWYFSQNKNPDVVRYLIAHTDEIDLESFSANPGAITWLRANVDRIDNDGICGNSAAIDIIQSLPAINYNCLSCNDHPWAIEQIRLNINHPEIDWGDLSANPGIFHYVTDPRLIAELSQ